MKIVDDLFIKDFNSFYKIPKTGKLSHEEIIFQSENFLLPNRDISLDASCKRRSVSEKKSHIFDEFIKAGKGVDEIPWDKLVEYGEQDVKSTYELAYVQAEMLDIELEKWAKNETNY